jgi:phospholipid transport system substrate-binding protein
MKYFLVAFLAFFPSFVMANMDPAVQAKKAEMFITALGSEAIEALENAKGNPKSQYATFKRILNNKFDMDTIARFALARYWAVATEAERKEYTKLFKKLVVDVYSKRFEDYSGQKFEVIGSKPAGRKDFIVNSLIQGTSKPIKVDWRIRNGRVIDVIVEGVSMSVTQRSEFASIIQRGGGQVSELIAHLEK